MTSSVLPKVVLALRHVSEDPPAGESLRLFIAAWEHPASMSTRPEEGLSLKPMNGELTDGANLKLLIPSGHRAMMGAPAEDWLQWNSGCDAPAEDWLQGNWV